MEEEILWDSKNPHYYNKIKKQDAREKIANELGTSSDECRKKSSNLLTSLRRENMKIKNSQGTEGGTK
nr:unnamed protein product [Callosobruchus analis]